MSKNTYFNGELIPSTSNFGRIGSSFAKNKEEARTKFIENINLINVINDTQKTDIINNPSLVRVDVTPANEDTCSKYTISVPPQQSPRLTPMGNKETQNLNGLNGLNDLNDYHLDFEDGGRRRKHSSGKRRRNKTKRRKNKSKTKRKR